MKTQSLTALLICAFGLTACSSGGGNSSPASTPESNSETAKYRLTFSDQWNATNFPTLYPSSAHFSGLIGTTHNEQVIFWQEGQPATAGIEQMAETGGKSAFTREIQSAIDDGKAQHLLSGGGISSTPGSVSIEFDVSKSYPLVTVVSMIAPSPDWFVGTQSLNLMENDNFVDSKTIDLISWDSGTDSGVQFTAANADEDSIIGKLQCQAADCDFVDGKHRNSSATPQYIGTFTFTKL